MSQTGTLINRSGFTLVELLVVIALLALLSFISLPLLAYQGHGAGKQVIRRIAGTVKQLNNEATLNRDEYLLTFNFNRNSILAFRLRSNSGMVEKESFGHELMLAPLRIEKIEVKGRGIFHAGQVSVRIFPLGWMEQTSLLLKKKDGTEVRLAFSPLTGSVTIDDEYTAVQ
jgi:general secretion pathway protein H